MRTGKSGRLIAFAEFGSPEYAILAVQTFHGTYLGPNRMHLDLSRSHGASHGVGSSTLAASSMLFPINRTPSPGPASAASTLRARHTIFNAEGIVRNNSMEEIGFDEYLQALRSHDHPQRYRFPNSCHTRGLIATS